MATWTEQSREQFEQAVEQFKGRTLKCFHCGFEGGYADDLTSAYVKIGEWSVREGDLYTASVNATFMCTDKDACKERQNKHA